MYIAVFLLLYESGVIFKGIGSRMLQYEHTPGPKQTARHTWSPEYPVWYCIQALDFIGRVSEYYVKINLADFQKTEDIVPDDMHAVYPECRGTAPDERSMQGIHLHRIYFLCAPGGKFIGYTACTGKQIKNPHGRQVILVAQRIEKSLLGKVSRRTGPESRGRHYRPAFQRSAYDSHDMNLTDENTVPAPLPYPHPVSRTHEAQYVQG